MKKKCNQLWKKEDAKSKPQEKKPIKSDLVNSFLQIMVPIVIF